jgi:membrane protease YdiL (CAAX protease family)
MLADTLPRQRIWPTLAWTGAGALALILAQVLGVGFYVLSIRLTHHGQALSSYSILHSNLAILGSTVFSTLGVIPLLWGMTRMRTPAVREYLALSWPGLRQVLVAVVAFGVFMAGLTVLSRQFEASGDMAFMLDEVSAVRIAHAVPLLIAAAVVAAPIGEELVFRGFLYRTLELKFGGIAAILATAFGWAVLHVQYSLSGMIVIFAGGLFFGAIRRYGGSLYLTMILHALWNGASVAGALIATTGH